MSPFRADLTVPRPPVSTVILSEGLCPQSKDLRMTDYFIQTNSCKTAEYTRLCGDPSTPPSASLRMTVVCSPRRRRFADAVQTGSRDACPYGSVGDGCSLSHSSLAKFFGGGGAGELSFKKFLPKKTTPHLPSHPLSRELSRGESLEDTVMHHGFRKKCGCFLPYFSLVKVFAEGVRGRSLFQKASSPKKLPLK